MIVVAIPFAMAATLSDISENADRKAIEYLHNQGIVTGYSDDTFRPEKTVNRAELLKVLIGSIGAQASADEFHDCFPDVGRQWFAPYVCYAKERRWISGYANGLFHPELPVNTAEAIKMIVNTYGYESAQSSFSAPFNDIDPTAWYAPYVEIARTVGILDGTGERLGITEHVSRGKISGLIESAMRSRDVRTAPQTADVRATEEARRAASASERIRTLLGNASPRRGGGGAGGDRAEGNANSSGQRALSSPAISLGNLTKTYGDSAFVVTATSNSAGTITYASSDTDVATVAGNTITIVGAGTTTITVTQAESGDYAAGSTTATLTVAKAECSAALASNNNPSQFSQSVKLTASLTSGTTGIVTFYSGSLVLGSGSVVHHSGSLTLTTLKRGTGSLTAAYGGNTNFNSCTSPAMLQRVYRNQCLQAGFCRNGGTCTNIGDGFSCACVVPYSGVRCELSDSFCNPDHGGGTCFNGGICEASVSGGECNCADCYSGTFCDVYLPDACA